MDKLLKNRIVNLAAILAQQEAEKTGQEYSKCISAALDEACERLGVLRKDFIKMFL